MKNRNENRNEKENDNNNDNDNDNDSDNEQYSKWGYQDYFIFLQENFISTKSTNRHI